MPLEELILVAFFGVQCWSWREEIRSGIRKGRKLRRVEERASVLGKEDVNRISDRISDVHDVTRRDDLSNCDEADLLEMKADGASQSSTEDEIELLQEQRVL